MQKFAKGNNVMSFLAKLNYFLLMLEVGIFDYHPVYTQFNHFILLDHNQCDIFI